MHIVAIVLALVAAALHAWFFVLESLWFMRPSVHRRFGMASAEQAEIARSFAYNRASTTCSLPLGSHSGSC